MLAKFSATMFRDYAAALAMRQRYFMPSNASTLLTIIISCSVLLVTIQPICAKGADEQLVAAIKLSALKAESVGDLAKAEFLYLKALAESEKTGSTLRILESLVHVVHIKTIRGKLKEAEPFCKRAIDVAQNAMRKPGCNAEITVWLDDLADSYYSAGQFTSNKKIKEFCLEHYIDSKMLCSTKYDPELITKINLLSSHYMMEGRYAEAEKISQRARTIADRNANRPRVPGGNQGGAALYLIQRKFPEAEQAYREAHSIDLKIDPAYRYCHEGNFEQGLGLVEFEKNNLNAAEAHFAAAQRFHQSRPNCLCVELPKDTFLLGLVKERKGEMDAATKYFQETVNILQKHPSNNPSLSVVPTEHLISLLQKNGKYSSAKSLKASVNKIRAQHPEWQTISNPDPERHFRICGALPFSIEIIPTRTVRLF